MTSKDGVDTLSDEDEEFASASEGEDQQVPGPSRLGGSDQAGGSIWSASCNSSLEIEPENGFSSLTQFERPPKLVPDERSCGDSVKPEAEFTAGHQSSASWGSLGSWLSMAVNTATDVIATTDVDKLYTKAQLIGQNIRSVTAEQVDVVYEALDPDFRKEKFHEEGHSKTSTSPEVRDVIDKATEVTDPSVDHAEAILSTIDKTFDFASNALGQAVFGGYNMLQSESTKLQEKIQIGKLTEQISAAKLSEQLPVGKIAEKIPAGPEMDTSGILHRSVDVGGNVVSSGLDALEFLGRRAIGGLIGAKETAEEHHLSWLAEVSELSLEQLFVENTGSANLDAIESLSKKCHDEYSTLVETLPSSFSNAQEIYEVETQLSSDAIMDAVQETEQSILFTQADLKNMVMLLEEMGVKASTHVRQLRSLTRKLNNAIEENVAAFEKDCSEVMQGVWNEAYEKKHTIKQLIFNAIKANYEAGIRVLATFAAKCCEQMLRLAEIFLVQIAENRLRNENTGSIDSMPVQISRSLCIFVAKLLTEVHFVCGVYIRTIQAVVAAAKQHETVFDSIDWDAIDQQVLHTYDQLHQNSRTAAKHIQNASSSLVNVLKLMVAENKAKSLHAESQKEDSS